MGGKVLKYMLVLVALLPALLPGYAQNVPPRVEARFVPDSVAIGDHFRLEVTVQQDVMQIVAFPEFDDGLIGGVLEILDEGPADTLERKGRSMTLRKNYRLTGFEEGYYGFGPYPMLYIDKNITDTIWSADSLRIMVATFDIDTLTQTIFDIKRPLDAPLKPGEFLGWTALAMAGILLIGGILAWLVIRRRKNLTLFGKPKPVDPPHVAAIKSLEILHNQKLWQNHKYKAYYTGLTDILREYLEGRYGVRAMEMTSDEIIESLAGITVPEKNFSDLRNILSTADLVKFAKYTPADDYNETAYQDAYYFVENTKPTEVERVDPGEVPL